MIIAVNETYFSIIVVCVAWQLSIKKLTLLDQSYRIMLEISEIFNAAAVLKDVALSLIHI